MKIFDISPPLSGKTINWPGDPKISFTKIKSIKKGDSCNLTKLAFGSHSGSHIDAPNHFFGKGKTVDKISLKYLIGPAIVVEIGSEHKIGLEDLVRIDLKKRERILFKTKNSALFNGGKFNKDFVYLTSQAAKYLVKKNLKLVGIDYLSVGSYNNPNENIAAHKIMLKAGVAILEGINLSGIKPGDYQMICLPLKISGGDGSPARTILIK